MIYLKKYYSDSDLPSPMRMVEMAVKTINAVSNMDELNDVMMKINISNL
jgi:hypothetical protein